MASKWCLKTITINHRTCQAKIRSEVKEMQMKKPRKGSRAMKIQTWWESATASPSNPLFPTSRSHLKSSATACLAAWYPSIVDSSLSTRSSLTYMGHFGSFQRSFWCSLLPATSRGTLVTTKKVLKGTLSITTPWFLWQDASFTEQELGFLSWLNV